MKGVCGSVLVAMLGPSDKWLHCHIKNGYLDFFKLTKDFKTVRVFSLVCVSALWVWSEVLSSAYALGDIFCHFIKLLSLKFLILYN